MIYDPNTLSNIDEVKTTHLDLNFIVDFERKILDAVVILKLVTLVDNVNKVILDTSHLNIKSASCSGVQLKHHLEDRNEKFGSALHIQLDKNLSANTEFDLTVNYNTLEQGTAVQWLEPIQTSGKKYPYLFTQCQAIHARSLLPCQDTPSFKLSYNASVQVPQPLRALMSAIEVCEEVNVETNTKTYKFEQTVKIPSYLIALAVGNLEGKKIGPRSTVWSEPEVVESAAWEFVDTEKFIETGENLLTPYEWKKYDLLVLPASFPYGGMENPCLTFVTPTLLAGDRSLVDVVAHEISHSWMGNLVTTSNWEHFWLNEGWTVFIERKIMGRLHGEKASEFDAIIGWRALKQDIDLFGQSNVLTALTPKLKGVDPDDSFSSVPYEKGFNFLYHIQKVVGGPQNFEPYMKAHVQEFAGKSITTDDWKKFLYSFADKNFPEKRAKLDEIQWDAWLHAPGMKTNLIKHLQKRALNWLKDNKVFDEFSPSDIENFSPEQKMVFLEIIFDYSPLPCPVIEALNKFYCFMDVRNAEIRFRWQQVCLKSEYEPIFPHVVKFVTEQGRMKYVRPLYRLLNQTKNGSDLAKKTFEENRSFYHPIAAAMIAKDILKEC
ncbi:28603_t:CDS:10 [Dentiscutata erythropus]|uniref:28603_t:CDS:1 n=1 Tax=Dentiscutata erythropus TaxID=1348616 RepID=A0A9N9DI83_9GLOM|nr:28603_t:CDS:10 [Dentiscutata erythropus]